jgi:HSP20 family molecular chaperone IbpA
MPKLMVHQAEEPGAATINPWFGEAGDVTEAIRRRAYELFEQRGCLPGGELDDWLRAEGEIVFVPQAEVKETAKSFSVKMAAPGFAADDIDVIALPQELRVEARTERRPVASETYEPRFLCGRFDLTAPIRTEKVTARFDEGVLTMQAPNKVQAVPAQAAAA